MSKTFQPAYDGLINDAVRQHWGIETLRPLQREAIDAVVAGRDLLAVMPTGHGKSLCYQAPAAIQNRAREEAANVPSRDRKGAVGLTLVVSPLIALMEDQVGALRHRGIPAEALHSGLPPRVQADVEQQMCPGELALVYCSPERLTSPPFITLLKQCRVRNIVIDEAHCISQWGHDFRPSYAALGNLRKLFSGVPIHAFTATATPQVRDEIVEVLGLRDPVVLVGDFDRPNLRLSVIVRTCLERLLVEIIRERPGTDGIIYCPTRIETERVASHLTGTQPAWGGGAPVGQDAVTIDARPYHAGLDDDQRHATQQWFCSPIPNPQSPIPNRVIVATIAFGMGINKPDVRWIIHTMMPSSMETYHQEIGRAGRDGEPAECFILFDHGDWGTWQERIWSGDLQVPLEHFEHKIELLCEMNAYCVTPVCRHDQLVEYFVCASAGLWTPCNACDICIQNRAREEAATNPNRDRKEAATDPNRARQEAANGVGAAR